MSWIGAWPQAEPEDVSSKLQRHIHAQDRKASLILQKSLTRSSNPIISSISNVQFLNNDILRFILILLAQDLGRSEGNDWAWYTLAQVSRQWSSIAFSTPAFWSSIVSSSSYRMISTQLSRSRNVRLSFTLRNLSPLMDSHRVDWFQEAISTNEERVAELYIETKALVWECSKPFLEQLPSRLEVLHVENLKGFLPKYNDQRFPEVPLENILTLTNLRSLSLHSLRSSPLHTDNFAPLSRLTEITFYEIEFPWLRLSELVRLFPNLEKLTLIDTLLDYVCDPEDEIAPSTQLQLPSLRRLEIFGIGAATVAHIASRLNMPLTSNWSIECTHVPVEQPPQHSDDHSRGQDHTSLLFPIFSRHTDARCDKLHISMSDRCSVFQTKCSIAQPLQTSTSGTFEKARSRNVTARTCVIIDHTSSRTLSQHCTSIGQLVFSSLGNWSTTPTFSIRIISESTRGAISQSAWHRLLDPFVALSSLEVTLISKKYTSQMELAKALQTKYPVYVGSRIVGTTAVYVGSRIVDTAVFLPQLKTLTLRLSHCRRSVLDELERTLLVRKTHNAGLVRLRIEYSSKGDQYLFKAIQEFSQNVFALVQELQIETGVEGMGKVSELD